jgi:hypothetical protein
MESFILNNDGGWYYLLFTFRILMFPDCYLQNHIHNGKAYFVLFAVIHEETTVDRNNNSECSVQRLVQW